jgi:hypothetical protein
MSADPDCPFLEIDYWVLHYHPLICTKPINHLTIASHSSGFVTQDSLLTITGTVTPVAHVASLQVRVNN